MSVVRWNGRLSGRICRFRRTRCQFKVTRHISFEKKPRKNIHENWYFSEKLRKIRTSLYRRLFKMCVVPSWFRDINHPENKSTKNRAIAAGQNVSQYNDVGTVRRRVPYVTSGNRDGEWLLKIIVITAYDVFQKSNGMVRYRSINDTSYKILVIHMKTVDDFLTIGGIVLTWQFPVAYKNEATNWKFTNRHKWKWNREKKME